MAHGACVGEHRRDAAARPNAEGLESPGGSLGATAPCVPGDGAVAAAFPAVELGAVVARAVERLPDEVLCAQEVGSACDAWDARSRRLAEDLTCTPHWYRDLVGFVGRRGAGRCEVHVAFVRSCQTGWAWPNRRLSVNEKPVLEWEVSHSSATGARTASAPLVSCWCARASGRGDPWGP